MNSPSLDVFKASLDGALLEGVSAHGRRVELDGLEDLFPPKPSCDSIMSLSLLQYAEMCTKSPVLVRDEALKPSQVLEYTCNKLNGARGRVGGALAHSS